MCQGRETSVCIKLSPSCNAWAMCGPECTPLWDKIPPEGLLQISQPTHLHSHPSLIYPTTQQSSRRKMEFLFENFIAMGTWALKFWQHSMKSSFYLLETLPNGFSGHGSSTGKDYLQCLKNKWKISPGHNTKRNIGIRPYLVGKVVASCIQAIEHFTRGSQWRTGYRDTR